MKLDFSVVRVDDSSKTIEESFNKHCNTRLRTIQQNYPIFGEGLDQISLDIAASDNLDTWLNYLLMSGGPQVYVIIDEYDNFANQLITNYQDRIYEELTAGDSYLRTFFKVLKQGRQTGAIANIFITGVLPITIDDLASGYNIGTFLTLDPEFEHMVGFTPDEVVHLLDNIYQDYGFDAATKPMVMEVIKSQYDGYHLATADGMALFNPTMLMFFLRQFCLNGTIPNQLTDLNIRTDLGWVKRITGMQSEDTETFIRDLTLHDTVPYDEDFLVTKFNMSQFFQKSYYPISFFYLGLLTRKDEFSLSIPNLNIRKIMTEYLNELYHIDVSTRYEDAMRRFVQHPDLPRLFADYWQLYVSQLPEAIFTHIQENFYRTTFYELCSRYLSKWFTWNVERSYPGGRTDLEFVGKYNEKFAHLRILIEFKYISNTKFQSYHCPIENFPLKQKDTLQITGYARDLIRGYPEVTLKKYVIY